MMRWAEVVENPRLQNLPFKIETDRVGQIVMSPASNRHGIVQNKIGAILTYSKPDGEAISECSVETPEGVKVADIAWASTAFLTIHGDQIAYSMAPELCVEIRSPSNSKPEMTEKKVLYFQQGAHEVWISDLSGHVAFFDPNGEIERSRLFPQFPTQIL
ncbi:MAG: Uma2 family endonuclease [Planctomycetaceae bacterium]|nr:Uma2 family endonuclease [Planctomycetaceae bacterium]